MRSYYTDVETQEGETQDMHYDDYYRVREAMELERKRLHDERHGSLGRRQAAFARATEALACIAFATAMDQVAATIELARFFMGDS